MGTLLQINELCKTYDQHVIFDHATLSVSDGQKIAVVGRNGAGKSTLFRLITHAEDPDSGLITLHGGATLGYLTQEDQFLANETVREFLLRGSGKELWQCDKMAGQFQLKGDLLDTEIGKLSGGYQMRVKLTAMLLQDPSLLLLDEPTNYLDLSTLLLLEHWLSSYNGTFMLVSHDREFLKNTCSETLEVDRGQLFFYPRPLEEYLAHKAERVATIERYNKKIDREERHLQSFVDRFRYKASKATQAQSKLKQISRLKKIDIVHPISTARIRIPNPEPRKGLALRANKLTIGYGEHIIASDITLDLSRGEHVALLGDNGQGKSTLLKTFAGILPPLSGTVRWMPHIEIGYYAQHVPSMLPANGQIYHYLEQCAAIKRREDILEMAGNFLFRGDDVKKPIAVLSGGERARLSLAGLLLAKKSVLLLDEPTNHLDVETVEALGRALQAFTGTIVFVSHNRTFVNLIATNIVEVKKGSVKPYPHNYEEYVYHLEKTLGFDREEAAEPPALPAFSAEERDALRAAIKEKKKILRETEHDLAEYEKEKQSILNWFQKHPTDYAPDKTRRLKEVMSLITETESKWLSLQQEVERATSLHP